MPYMIVSLIVSTLAFLLASYMVPGFTVANIGSAALAAVVLGLCNALIRPFIILFTLPVTVLTLGLFLVVVNGLVLALAVWLVPGVDVANLWVAILAGLVISIINAVLGAVLG